MRAMVVYGTRPEWIKLREVIRRMENDRWTVDQHWTGQSPDLFPEKVPNPRPWPNLASGIATVVNDLGQTIRSEGRTPDLIVVQGDTASAFAGAVAGFLSGIDVAHVEAGMRTYRHNPHPEEAFRQAIRPFAKWHFCPSRFEAANIMHEEKNEGGEFSENGVYIVGNPVIDALRVTGIPCMSILCTMHRREHWGKDGTINQTLRLLRNFAYAADGLVKIEVIKHPNWDAAEVDQELTHTIEANDGSSTPDWNVISPVSPTIMANLVKNADYIVTDSGGLQEEASFLGTPTLCVREATERTGLEALGVVECVSPAEAIVRLNEELDRRLVYGKGQAAGLISGILTDYYGGITNA